MKRIKQFFANPTTDVTHNYFFGENLRRVINTFKYGIKNKHNRKDNNSNW